MRYQVASVNKEVQEEEEEFTSSANQLGSTTVPGLSVTRSKPPVLSVYHTITLATPSVAIAQSKCIAQDQQDL